MNYQDTLSANREYVIDLFQDLLMNKSQLSVSMKALLMEEEAFNKASITAKPCGALSKDESAISKVVRMVSDKANEGFMNTAEFQNRLTAFQDKQIAKNKEANELYN